MKRRQELAVCLMVPHKWNLNLAQPAQQVEITVEDQPTAPNSNDMYSHWTDPYIFHASLFTREFVSTLLLLLLRSRLGSSLFIAGPIVIFYINIVFRRPLNNSFVLIFACFSAGDWKKANVAGYPGFDRNKTPKPGLWLYCLFLLAAQLSGAASAAAIKASYSRSIGSESMQAWGVNQVYLKVKENSPDSCWKNTTQPIPASLFGDQTADYLDSNCTSNIQEWWFMEDLGAVFFLIVSYLHIWKWLRWDDEEHGNPTCMQERYWEKIVSFSVVSSILALTTAIAFPTAHAGWHTSLYLCVYQKLRNDLQVTSNAMLEPLIRGSGGFVGCLLAMVYEWSLARYFKEDRNAVDILMFKLLYHNSKMDAAPKNA